jgi:hypothetical protein
MKATQPVYSTTYRSLRLSRDAQGVLLVEFHTKGGPLTFTAQVTPSSSTPLPN